MTTGEVLCVAMGVVGLASVIYVIYTKSKTTSTNKSGSSSTSLSSATTDQFKKFKSALDASGSDTFQWISAAKLNDFQNSFVKKLSVGEADKMISLASKKESTWSSSDKAEFDSLFTKITGKSSKS